MKVKIVTVQLQTGQRYAQCAKAGDDVCMTKQRAVSVVLDQSI